MRGVEPLYPFFRRECYRYTKQVPVTLLSHGEMVRFCTMSPRVVVLSNSRTRDLGAGYMTITQFDDTGNRTLLTLGLPKECVYQFALSSESDGVGPFHAASFSFAGTAQKSIETFLEVLKSLLVLFARIRRVLEVLKPLDHHCYHMLVVQSIHTALSNRAFLKGHCLSIGLEDVVGVELCFVFDDHRGVMVIDGAIYDWFHEELLFDG